MLLLYVQSGMNLRLVSWFSFDLHCIILDHYCAILRLIVILQTTMNNFEQAFITSLYNLNNIVSF